MKEFLLTEKKANKQTQNRQQHTECIPGQSTQSDRLGPSSTTYWTQPAKKQRPQRKPQQPKRKGTVPTKLTTKSGKEIEQRSKEAALAQSKLGNAKQRQRDRQNSPRIQLDTTNLHSNKSVEVTNLASDSSQGSPQTIFTFDDPNIFMSTPANKRNTSPTKTKKKIDKIIKRISSSPKKHPAEPETEKLISIIPASSSTPIGTNNIKTPQHSNAEQTSAPMVNNNTNAPQQKNTEQTPTPTDNNTNARKETNKEQIGVSEERQDKNTEQNNIHTEEGQEDEYSGTSSISSLNTTDIEALNKIFD